MKTYPSFVRRSLLAAAVLLTVGGAANFAEAQSRFGGHGAQRFAEADADGDGVLTLDEMIDQASLRFAEADADGDGALTPEELRAHREAQREERCGEDGASCGRGGESGGHGPHGGQGERGGDGERGGRGGHGPRQALVNMDTDGDGSVSQAEFEAGSASFFAELDRNGDGMVDANDRPSRPE